VSNVTSEIQNLQKNSEVPNSKGRSFINEHGYVIYPILTIILMIVVYILIKELFNMPSYILPSFTEIMNSMYKNSGILLFHTMITTGEILLGFVLSIVGGVMLAILIYYSKTFEQAVYPILVVSQAVPKAAIAPLFVVWMGFGLSPKILVAFLIAFFPIVVDTVVGFRSTPPEMISLVRSMGASSRKTFIKIILPNALPNFFAGIKVAITLAVSGAIIGEFVGANKGLGYLLLVANGQMQTALLFSGIIVLSIIGILLFYAVAYAEKICIPWHVSNRDHQ
jgi:NitT/TauT family transport system permease protein